MRVLVTGAAGFIGAATSKALLAAGHQVVGIDNLNDYYDPSLKEARLALLADFASFQFRKVDLADRASMDDVFRRNRFQAVIHLGAQAGVRHSLERPLLYVESNLLGTTHVLEGCRHHGVESIVYASTSSVYGLQKDLPYSTDVSASHPISIYSATKRSTELITHSYSHLFGLPSIGLRLFTVYGPWGRPDMALFKFTRAIIEGKPIKVFNRGSHTRDFTYIDDVVTAIMAAVANPAKSDPAFDCRAPAESTSSAPWRIYNVGSANPIPLMYYIELIEKSVGRKAIIEFLPPQPGDVADTFADIGPLIRDLGVRPKTPVEEGVSNFVHWFQQYYML